MREKDRKVKARTTWLEVYKALGSVSKAAIKCPRLSMFSIGHFTLCPYYTIKKAWDLFRSCLIFTNQELI